MLDQYIFLLHLLRNYGFAVLLNWTLGLGVLYMIAILLDRTWISKRRIRFDREKPTAEGLRDGSKGFSQQVRQELLNAAWTSLGGILMVTTTAYLEKNNLVRLQEKPGRWDQIAKEFTLYFVLFDFYYYVLHRFVMHSKVVSFCNVRCGFF